MTSESNLNQRWWGRQLREKLPGDPVISHIEATTLTTDFSGNITWDFTSAFVNPVVTGTVTNGDPGTPVGIMITLLGTGHVRFFSYVIATGVSIDSINICAIAVEATV